ncbi:MAG TPA: glycosyltransferase family 2 protein [candidate division Zixibacteria bacterium]|nr:glycosyltransferase family 2 protein [candidate division Zixibacteria bacterium]
MGVSVVMVTYASYPLTRRLLEPLAAGIGRELEEIILVDSASPDQTGERLKADFPTIDYLSMLENQGYGSAVNRGAAQAKGEWLLILNGDVEIHPPQVNRLQVLAETNGADLIAPLQETPEGEPIPTVRNFPTPMTILFARRSPLGRLFGRRGGYLRSLPGRTEPVEGAVGGACFLVKKKKFQQVGGFDPNFFLFVEDIDLCRRLSNTGARIFFTPEVKVRHFWSFSTGQDFLETLRCQHESLLYYFKKNFPDYPFSQSFLAFLFWLQRSFYRLFERKR